MFLHSAGDFRGIQWEQVEDEPSTLWWCSGTSDPTAPHHPHWSRPCIARWGGRLWQAVTHKACCLHCWLWGCKKHNESGWGQMLFNFQISGLYKIHRMLLQYDSDFLIGWFLSCPVVDLCLFSRPLLGLGKILLLSVSVFGSLAQVTLQPVTCTLSACLPVFLISIWPAWLYLPVFSLVWTDSAYLLWPPSFNPAWPTL